ncbi:MAG: hypothetical protein QNJ98_09435 [Planctomycetota bacterium]|nr:hypothetical protein [Planctomycetota bacterium]
MRTTEARARGLPRRRLTSRVGSLLALLLVCGPLAHADDELPDPVIRKVPSKQPARKPAAPAARAPRPAPAAARPPQPQPAPRPAPAPKPRLREGGELPPPVVRRIPADPARVQPGEPVPLRPGPRPVVPAPMPGASAPGLPFDDEPPPPPPDDPPDFAEGPRRLPGDVSLEVDPEDGLLEGIDTGDQTAAIVMLGSPRILRTPSVSAEGLAVPGLSIKAHRMVVWVDREKVPALQGFSDLSGSLSGEAPREEAQPTERTAPADLGTDQNIVPDALREIYAEGAVELIFDDVVFRAERLYLDPHRYVALLIKPAFDGYAAGRVIGDRRVPIYVRAQRARVVGRGLTVFEDFEVSTSRADDRILLRGETLTVEEFEEGRAEGSENEPHFLGYRRSSTQEYTLRRMRLEGERVPLFYIPYAQFGFSTQGEAFTSILRGFDVGRRGNLGNYAFLELGGDLLSEEGRKVTWTSQLGGYGDRGPAAGGEIAWDTMPAGRGLQSRGLVEGFGVYDDDGLDQNDFQAPDEWRWRVHTESRTLLARDLHFDFEFSEFSDRGFNLEFFERDELTHKDYESYGRLYWAPRQVNGLVATLTGKWHQRDFVTETTLLPQGGLWLTGVPLVVPQRRGGPGIDVTSWSDFGRLSRRFDEDLPLVDYESWRLSTETRVNAGFDVGDLRFSGWFGGVADSYRDRDDGGEDLTRTAMLAGARANLQLSKVYAGRGGPFRLDGLRHVVDIDLEWRSRFEDSHELSEVPFYDRRETYEDQSTVTLRTRHRFQTRRSAAGRRARPPLPPGAYRPTAAVRTLLDAELSLHGYVNDQGPYQRDTPGAFEAALTGQLTDHISWLGETLIDIDGGNQRSAFGVGYTFDRELGLQSLGAGVRYVRGESLSLRGDLAYRWSKKYGGRLQWAYDFRDAESVLRAVVRRHSDDHIWELGIRLRDDDVGLEFGFEPAIGGRAARAIQVFEDEPTLNPRGLIR